MGLLRWLRGGDGADASVSGMSTGLAELEAVFVPSKRKQTELIEEQTQSRVDLSTGEPLDRIDLDNGTAVVHRRSPRDADDDEVELVAAVATESAPGDIVPDVAEHRLGDELDGDGGQQQTRNAGEHLDAAALDESHDH